MLFVQLLLVDLIAGFAPNRSDVRFIFAERVDGEMTIRRGFEVKESENYIICEILSNWWKRTVKLQNKLKMLVEISLLTQHLLTEDSVQELEAF